MLHAKDQLPIINQSLLLWFTKLFFLCDQYKAHIIKSIAQIHSQPIQLPSQWANTVFSCESTGPQVNTSYQN